MLLDGTVGRHVEEKAARNDIVSPPSSDVISPTARTDGNDDGKVSIISHHECIAIPRTYFSSGRRRLKGFLCVIRLLGLVSPLTPLLGTVAVAAVLCFRQGDD